MKLSEIVKHVGGSVRNPSETDVEITGVAALRDADAGDISFLANKKYAPQVLTTKASAVFVANDFESTDEVRAILVRVESPDRAFAETVPHFAPPPVVHAPGAHATAVIGEGTQLGEGTHVGAYAVIGNGCVIGKNCIIEAHVVLGEGCVLGDDVHLYPMASVRERCRLGNRVIVHNGAVIGSDGYGYATQMNPDGTIKIDKIPQMGIVELCDDVEIGANTTIDRARFGVTRIGRFTKIDNLVQIAHNVQIGDFSGVASQVGISGSTKIGSQVMLWGQVGLAGHLDIADGVEIFAQSGVSRDLAKGVYFGTPAVDRREALRNMHVPKAVENLKKEIAELKKKLVELESEK